MSRRCYATARIIKPNSKKCQAPESAAIHGTFPRRNEMSGSMELVRIGTVRRKDGRAWVEIEPGFREGLEGLEEFSHCHVLWWVHENFGFDARNVLSGELPYAPGHRAGVFACRGPFRPNPIAMTVCPIRAVDREAGTVEVADIDAFDGSPVVDVKAYYGCCDRVNEPRVPAWLPDWGAWVPDQGIGLED
jgi:tRNA-Thr(GGU) m(6)t(6)A37 methyltransferase TsaA